MIAITCLRHGEQRFFSKHARTQCEAATIMVHLPVVTCRRPSTFNSPLLLLTVDTNVQPHETQPRLLSGLRRLKISDDRTKVDPPVERRTRHVSKRCLGST